MGGWRLKRPGIGRRSKQLLWVSTLGFLFGCSHWDDIHWVAKNYERDWNLLDHGKIYQDYLSDEAKAAISVDDFVSAYPFAPNELTTTRAVMGIYDTDRPTVKIVVLDGGKRCTFVLQDGRWRRAWSASMGEEAADLVQAGKFREGIRLYRKAQAIDPYDLRPLLGLAWAHRKDTATPGHFQEALNALQRGEQLEAFGRSGSVTAEIETEFGNIYLDQKEMAQAEGHYRKALAALPEDADTNLNYACFLFKTGRAMDGSGYLAHCFRVEGWPDITYLKGLLKALPPASRRALLERWIGGARAGDRGAQISAGLAMIDGWLGPKDPAQGAIWIRTAAVSGAKRACIEMAWLCEHGVGVRLDTAEAMHWLLVGAGQGEMMAQRSLGRAYLNGAMVSRDPTRAAKFFMDAARQGDAWSYTELGRMNSKGVGMPVDPARAFRWFRAAAIEGNAPGETALAFLYNNGTGVAKDPVKAEYWYLMALDRDANAGEYLGIMYALGKGVKRDPQMAAKYFRCSADLGNQFSQGMYATYLWNGTGVPRDRKAAIDLYKKGAGNGDNYSRLYLGQALMKGEQVKQDKKAGLHWIEMAASEGYPRAEEMLGKLYLSETGMAGKPARGIQWIQKAADQGNTTAMVDLGFDYETGKGVPLNESKSLEYYRKAASAGDAYAQCYIGRACEAGRGQDRDFHEAVEWYKLAAAQGDAYAIGRLQKLDPAWAPKPDLLPAPDSGGEIAGRKTD
jgi:TPR repeat protein